jgi:formamidopyrimidine-DNA glycosylase
MPELPEVETVRKKLQPLAGRTISSFWNDWPRGLKAAQNYKELSSDIKSRKVIVISRHGKVIFMELGGKNSKTDKIERSLAFHLRMSGRLYTARRGDKIPPKELKHIHATVAFTDGTELRFHDPRKFGLVWYGTPEKVRSYPYFSGIGPDALHLSLKEFRERLLAHGGMIKPLLLRQDFIAGVGNIVADETLWDSKIHPRNKVERLTASQTGSLHRSLMKTLRRGIKAGGATLRDWKNPDNKNGEFQKYMKVYGRKDEPCPRCGNRIKRIVVGGRGTWICTKCQRS